MRQKSFCHYGGQRNIFNSRPNPHNGLKPFFKCGEIHKKAYEHIWLLFFQFSTDFFEIFKISFFGLNGGVRSDLTPLHTVPYFTTKLYKMKVH